MYRLSTLDGFLYFVLIPLREWHDSPHGLR